LREGNHWIGLTNLASSAQGRVFFQNVPPGSVTLTATPRAALGKPVSQATVTVDAGTSTAVRMYPMPMP
jgi:hypothetical protein